MGFNALYWIDKLIAIWSEWESKEDYYLNTLAPAIVRGETELDLIGKEVTCINRLRSMLSPQEWSELPQLVAKRRMGILQEIESDRQRSEKREQLRRKEAARRREMEKARQEQERREVETKRKQQEELCRRERELEEKRQALRTQLHHIFQSDFLSADTVWAMNDASDLLSRQDYEQMKADFVRKWERQILQGDHELHQSQAMAVAAINGDIQVVARAGAGKTHTLVTRALFLQQHCGMKPNELLLLAFNNKAAKEMKERLCKVLKGQLPHVMTFHALAYALLHPGENLISDDAGELRMSREIQAVIDAHLQSPKFNPMIKQVMLSHFENDWERIEKGGFYLPIPELIAYRDALPRETLNGEYVKSFGEKLIANTLLRNGVTYKYERNFRWNGVNYRPDFTILFGKNSGVVIEYFGLSGTPDYDEMSEQKRQFWAKRPEWKFLEFTQYDITARGESSFKALLLSRLNDVGVQTYALSNEEIWELIKRRAVDNFTKAMRSLVSRCRKRNLSVLAFESLVKNHTPLSETEATFLKIGISVYAGYLEKLKANNYEDFDGLMWRAVTELYEGLSEFKRDSGRETGDIRNLRFVLIDEFQDFSQMFYEMTQGIRALSPEVQFFCVGDDWQAINGFAGSELRFFENFPDYFKDSRRIVIDKNYRSPRNVVEVGNALMSGLGEPASSNRTDAGLVEYTQLNHFVPTTAELNLHDGDELTPAILRLVKRSLDQGYETVILSRRNAVTGYVNYTSELYQRLNGLPRFEEHIRSFLPREEREQVTVSTVHKYKGKQKPTVIVLGVNKGNYPLIHPNWVFLRVFGNNIASIDDEERRLFYVALTRAQEELVIFSSEVRRESPYMDDIRQHMSVNSITWGDLLPVPALDGERLEVRISFPYNKRRNEQLKAHNFQWNVSGKYWCRIFMAEDFEFSALTRKPWVQPGVYIGVYSELGELLEEYPSKAA